jgi:leader peptidase (prepilin peptidase)/N-methyltransferase
MALDLIGQVLAGLGGAAAGVAVMGIADHFARSRGLAPLPICRACGARRASTASMPLLGPLLTRYRCRQCSGTGPWRLALLVQLVSAILGVLLYRRYGVGILLPCTAVEATVLLAVAVIDLEHRLIPTLLIYPTVLFAVAYSPAWPNLGIVSSLLGGALAFALFFGLAFVARVTFGEGALGDGDVTLAALIGVITGYPMVVVSLALGALFGGLGAILLVLLRRTPFGSTIPYGPFLVAGVIYILVIGNTMHPLYGVM